MAQSDFFRYANGLHRLRISLNGLEHSMPDVASKALKRTVDYLATLMVKEVTSTYAIKSKDVRATLRKHYPARNSLYAYVRSLGRPLSLSVFPHTPKTFKSKPTIVKVKIKKSEGYKAITSNPKAFVQKIYGDEFGIYERKDNRKMPVKILRSLSIPQMLNNREVIARIETLTQIKLQERIEHEYNRAIERAQRTLRS